jgi:hypothetical protein
MVFHGSVPPETLMRRERAEFARRAGRTERKLWTGEPAGLLGPTSANLQQLNFRSLPDQGLNHGAGAKLWWSRN